jgi:hypothetical protein
MSYYLSCHIDLKTLGSPKCTILTFPAMQEKATKEQILVAIILCVKGLLNIAINNKPISFSEVVTLEKSPGTNCPEALSLLA